MEPEEPQEPPKPEHFTTLEELYEEYLEIRREKAKNMPKGDSFYAVYLPDVSNRYPEGNVFTDKAEAMKMMKKSKKARFRQFTKYRHAVYFASEGFVDPPKSPQRRNGYSSSLNQQILSERLSPFKPPKPQDLVKLRKIIEAGDIERFKSMVWSNPRYLVSNGDTPSILQEGSRYNALHIAAKAKHASLAEAVLNIISDSKFIKSLYGEDYLCDNVEARIQVLLDLYLNTPDKGLNETPLHFASKYGALEVVETLVSFAECDKTLKNKFGQTAEMIICDRCENKEELEEVKKKMALLLDNCFYVPVLRSEDGSAAATVGQPFSPGNPPVSQSDPLSPRLEIHAYAGPMNREGADHFRKAWRTPPTSKKRTDNDDSFHALRYTDLNKGLERVGQMLANKYDVTWKEYWAFLNCFIDITSEEGLQHLENHFRERYMLMDKAYKNSPDSPDQMSAVAELCVRMQSLNIRDVGTDFRPYVCVDKACEVFANRFINEFVSKMNDTFHNFVLAAEMQTKHLELCMLSYMDDFRFGQVTFSAVHNRVALLIANELYPLNAPRYRVDMMRSVRNFATECIRLYDCFSSDDEANYPEDHKPTSTKRQLICILRQFLEHYDPNSLAKQTSDDEQTCREIWNKLTECSCVFHFKRPVRSLGIGRHSRMKSAAKASRKLIFEKNAKKSSDSSTEEEFFTPPTSPSDTGPSEDEFSDVPPTVEVFVENARPTLTDAALYKALKYSNCQITPDRYPHMYRWYHNVGLYTDEQRRSWPRPKPKDASKEVTPPRPSSFKTKSTHPPTPPISTSWLRITGANSPRTNFHNK